MKANELMIGDWVVYRGDTEYTSPVRIEGMDILTLSLITEDREDVGFDGIEPIPITAEILEKNGFKIVHGFGYSESYPTYGWGYHKGLRDYASVDITFYDEPIGGVSRLVKMETASKKDDGINYIHFCDIEFVHELQNALWLCGIEHEITL